MSENPAQQDFESDVVAEETEEQTVHHVSQRRKRKKGVGGEQMELQLTSMIDVIFQLLIYFIITANFVVDEGVIKAMLPGDSAPPTDEVIPPDPPTNIYIRTADDGLTYTLSVDSTPVDDISQLYGVIMSRLEGGGMDTDDTVNIHADKKVRWQHVVNVFNACVRADLEKVGFARP